MSRTHFSGRTAVRRRGVALLLVMVGLVVCTLLVAGFLSTQGTSIGIARNERDAERGRNCAQSGIDLCYWLIQNRADWRTKMTPGVWLSNAPVGDGSVTVSAADGDGSGDFADDPTASVILTAVGTSNGRNFSLTCRVSPTGGGTVFRGGSFALGQLIMHNSAVVDSYDSSVGAYNALFPGGNALFASNYNGAGALTMDGFAAFRGTFIGGPLASLTNLVNSILGLLLPTNVSTASQNYIPGRVLAPNTAGLTVLAVPNLTGTPSTNIQVPPGQYASLAVNGANAILASGVYRVTGNFSNVGTLTIPTGANVVFEIDGITTNTGRIVVQGTGTLALYVAGATTLAGNLSSAGGPGNFKIMGLSSANTLTIKGSGTSVTGVIFAPQASLYLTDSAKLFGAMIAKDVTADKTSSFHYDENTKNIRMDNITGGSAPQGIADYVLNRVGAS
jgi:hypothetical protein